MLLLEVKPIFRYVYHVTSKSNIPDIKQHGLLAVDKSTSANWQHLKYKKPSIFVTTRTSPELISDLFGIMVAKHNDLNDQNLDWDAELDNLVLITIDLSKCSNIDLEQDPNSMAYQRWTVLTGTVPPDSIVKIEPLRQYYVDF